jgi:uncharacterized protein (DUF1330 family)
MSKGYWMAHLDVRDREAYERYRSVNGVAFAKFGGRFLVRGGQSVKGKGDLKARHVVIEFPTYQAALDCLESPEYAEAAKFRDLGSDVDLVVVEGYDGPQPG